MNGNLILRGCLSINDFTSSPMQSLSQQCLLIFMIARPLSISAIMVERRDVFISFKLAKTSITFTGCYRYECWENLK